MVQGEEGGGCSLEKGHGSPAPRREGDSASHLREEYAEHPRGGIMMGEVGSGWGRRSQGERALRRPRGTSAPPPALPCLGATWGYWHVLCGYVVGSTPFSSAR